MVRAGSRQRKMAPSSINLPMRTSTGRQARCQPRGVRHSSSVSAPRAQSLCLAASRLLCAGGSMSRENTECRGDLENISNTLILKQKRTAAEVCNKYTLPVKSFCTLLFHLFHEFQIYATGQIPQEHIQNYIKKKRKTHGLCTTEPDRVSLG